MGMDEPRWLVRRAHSLPIAMRNHSARTLALALVTVALGLGIGCRSPSNDVPPQKTGEGPNDPNVTTDDGAKKKVSADEDPAANPDGIELKPVGQGGGPKDDGTDKPVAAPAVPPPPVVKKPATPAKPKPAPTAKPSSSAPPVWTPPPLPSGWVWPFPNTNAPPAGSTAPTTTPPPSGSTKPDAGPAPSTGGWTLPPFGGS